jgi:hypothetical protein
MLMRILAATACVATLGACASSGRDDGGGDAPFRAILSADALMFAAFDADGDLQTSRAEIDAGLDREFQRADVNRDTLLQPIEFQNWSSNALGGTQMGPYRLDFDRNVDNTITREEFINELQARAREYDRDENGAVTRSEMVRLVGQARVPTERRPPGELPPQR